MSIKERSFQDFSSEEKLDFIESCMDSFGEHAGKEDSEERREWLQRHIPAYKNEDGKNFVFVSYSHKDYESVYRDLAFFSYNTKKRVRFWYDEGLKIGEKWFEDAERMISHPNCVGVLFYLSRNFLKSSAVLDEINMVKKYKKLYFTTALEEGKNCAKDYLPDEEDAELLKILNDVFPPEETSLPARSVPAALSSAELPETYSHRHEDTLYRIGKIEAKFGVVEEVFSSFVFEEVEDGLSLAGYKGDESEVFIPEKVDGKHVVEVKASFETAHRIYIPRTIKRILPTAIEYFSYDNITNNGLDDMVRITETLYDIERGTPLELHKPRAIFGNAQNLSYIEVSESNPNFYAKDGVLYSGDTLLRFPTVKPWDNKYLDGVRVIGTGAVFNHHERVRPDLPIDPPTVPATVEEIGDHAFSSCTFWTIEISEGVKRIGVSAFAGCACLDDTPIPMVVPKSVEQIGENAFKAARFPAIILLSKLETIPRGAFLAFTGEMIEFKHSVNGIGERAFAECINLKDVRIPSISGQIGAYAFSGCKQLEAMTIPATVTDICDSAFSYCDSLSRLEISDGVKRIENGAFDSCKSIRYVTLPGSLEYLSPLSFNDCQSLHDIFYEGSVSDYEELSDASKFEDVFLGSPEHIVHKIILKNERFRRLRRRAMLKIGDFLRKYQ